MSDAICRECETVAHCTNHGCIPKQPAPVREPRLDQGMDYERGFIDGMQKQMQSSVDKAVNVMLQRQWVGLTDDQKLSLEIHGGKSDVMLAELVEGWLKEKNT